MRTRKKMYVVGYDISEDKRRRQIEKLLSRYGQRVNRSLFECMATPSQWDKILALLPTLIDDGTDVVVVYHICLDCYATSDRFPANKRRVERVKII